MFGTIAILVALGVAGSVLFRVGRPKADASRAIVKLKVVGLLAVAAVCFAAKLFPIALMILIAASGVIAIELWSGRAIKGMENLTPGAGAAPSRAALKIDEAAAILGVEVRASDEEVRAAHKKLIAQMHPDKGGTDYLAAKINDARKVMLEQRDPGARSEQNVS